MYALNLYLVIVIIILAMLIWFVGSAVINDKIFRIANIVVTVCAIYGIMKYTVLNRASTDMHSFRIMASYSNEFVREMVMNVFLYFPLGLGLANTIKRYWLSVSLGLLLSLSIEAWQYFAGTGLAQGTDVICNTLGVAIGGISLLIILKETT